MVVVMTAFRLIPLPIHGAVEMATGLLLMAAPFLFGFGTAAAVSAVVIGALVVGLSLSGSEPGSELPISAHYAFDHGLALGLFGAAFVVGLAGDRPAALFFALVAIGQLALILTTRYSRPR